MSKFHATILSIFPEMFPGPLGYSLAGQGLARNLWSYDLINIRDFGRTKHKNVDDTPMGGGNGLVMRPDVLGPALDHALEQQPNAKIYYPTPRGKIFNQQIAQEILEEKNIIFLCGRFEGIDERVIDEYNPTQINVGDYVLSGGEIAVFTILDAIIRLVPGVLANSNTLLDESFELDEDGNRLLEYPLYTKPNLWRGREVPEILVSGHHARINRWHKEKSLELTKQHRPDLLKNK